MAEQHTILGCEVYVYRRENSSRWQCSTYLAGRNQSQHQVEMIERYYASHIKTNLDAAAINVGRPKPVKRKAGLKPSRRTGGSAET